MFAKLQQLMRDEEAPTSVEYAMMAAGIGALIALAVYTLGDSVNAKFAGMDTKLNSR
jgi:pilus assembly protein Flp/PilA